MDVFAYLEDSVATIKRLGSILCGDEAGDGETWQRVALAQAHEMRHYAEVLERVARGKEGGGIVFPSWDEGWAGARTEPPMPPESVAGVPKSGVMPEWAAIIEADCDQRGDLIMRQDDRIASMRAKAWELQTRCSQLKGALAAAAGSLREGAEFLRRRWQLPRHGEETSKPMGCLSIEAEMRAAYEAAVVVIEGRDPS